MTPSKLSKRPFFQYGFWWWFDHNRKDWFVGHRPSNGIPRWAEETQ